MPLGTSVWLSGALLALLVLHADAITCPAGEFDNSGNCAPCDKTCLTCSASTANDCLTCYDGASLPTSTTPGACSCDAGLKQVGSSAMCCDSSCAESCLSSHSKDCVPAEFIAFHDTLQVIKSYLPSLSAYYSTICYDKPFPVANTCDYTNFEAITGTLDTDPTKWVLTELHCDKKLFLQWHYLKELYDSLFQGIALPTTDVLKASKAKATLMLWIGHFGHFAMVKDSKWQAFVTFLKGVTDWTKVSGTATQYTDGTTTADYPDDLKKWISDTSSTEYDLLNFWTAVHPTETECTNSACASELYAPCCSAYPTSSCCEHACSTENCGIAGCCTHFNLSLCCPP